jgi:16S rRNA processing protein RimM
MSDFLTVGKVVNTHGVRGEIKVMPMTSDISRFDYLLFVTANWDGKPKEFRVLGTRYQKNLVLLKLSGIETMNDAEKLKGQELLVDRKHAKSLEDGEYFVCDIIGLKVYEEDEFLGVVADVLETGSNDVYVIRKEDSEDILLPALKSVIEKVDIEGKRMQVRVPEGLTDDF